MLKSSNKKRQWLKAIDEAPDHHEAQIAYNVNVSQLLTDEHIK